MPTPPPPLPFFRHSVEPLLAQGLLFFCAEKGVGVDEEVVGVGGGGVGSEARRKCEFILTSAQCPSSPQLEEEGGGDLLTNPPFSS